MRQKEDGLRQKHILEEPVATTVISHRFSHVVWGSVFAGTIMVMVTQLSLAVLGGGIGLSALNVGSGDNNLGALGAGAITWWILSGIAAFYFGGWIAGRMAGIPRAKDGALHGILTWGVTTILMFLFLTTTIGAIVAGGFGLLKGTGQAVGSVAPQIAETPVFSQLRADINQSIGQTTMKAQNPQFMQQLSAALGGMTMSGNQDAQKQQVVSLLTQNTNMTPAEARSHVDRWTQGVQQIKQNAGQAAETASKGMAKAALASFAMLLLGAAACGIGGAVGAPHWSEQEIA
jgi:hypothetical protein